MDPVSLKLVLKTSPLFLLFVAQILRPVAGQVPPAPTPCKGATNTTNKIKDDFIFQGGLSQSLDPALARTLPFENEKSNAWSNSSLLNIPIDCKVAANGKCSLENMQVYDVLYDQSCTVPWTMCRCTQAEMSQTDTRDPFGMIGSKLRSYVRHIMAFPSPLGAWTESQNVMFYGPAGNLTIVSNFIHQATHAMDVALGNFSAQTNWTEAVDNDNCVADQSATVSYSEAFAQAMVVHMYTVLNNTLTLNISCMSNQLGVLQTVFPHDALFPKNCDLSVKPPASKTVAKVPDDGNIRPSSSSSATSQTKSTDVNSATSPTKKAGVRSAAIPGIVIGSFAFGVVTCVAFLFWHHRRIAQAKSQDANPYPMGEGPEGRVTQPKPSVTHGDENIIVIENSLPRLQKDGPDQTPPTGDDH